MDELIKAFSEYKAALEFLDWAVLNKAIEITETPEALAEGYALTCTTQDFKDEFYRIKSIDKDKEILSNAPALGVNQWRALRLLVDEHGYPGDGWTLNGHASTVKVLDTLVRHGLASKSTNNYLVTDAGRVILINAIKKTSYVFD